MGKLAIALVSVALTAWAGVAVAGMCGIMPIMAITPIGCQDLVAVCLCDENGNNCRWQWQCVR